MTPRELVRWLLFGPMLLVSLVIAAFIINVVSMAGGPDGWPGDVAASALLAYASVRLVVALAPRGKLVTAYAFAGAVAVLLGVAMVAFPTAPKELAKAAAWLVMIPLALLEQRRKLATVDPSPGARLAPGPARS